MTSGQFLIDSESKLREAFQKILASDGDSTDSTAATDSSDGTEHSIPNGETEGESHEGHAMPAEATGAAEHQMPHDGHDMRPESNEPKE